MGKYLACLLAASMGFGCSSQALSSGSGGGSLDAGYDMPSNGKSVEPGDLGRAHSDGGTVLSDGGAVDGGTALDGGGGSTAAICGDGVRGGAEECDDHNTTNLDGCDANCKFEQIHRVNYLKLQFAVDASFCPANALGEAISGSLGQSVMQGLIDDGISSGATSILFELRNLSDLTGATDGALQVGVFSGTPQTGSTGYSGTSDLDWWYTADPSTIDPTTRAPLTLIDASLASKQLTAGPVDLSLKVSLSGSVALLQLLGTRITIKLGASSAPTISAGGSAPGHLTTEHLDPMLTSFATAGGTVGTAAVGKLCGNTTAASLAQVAVPSALSLCGYSTTKNSLLDALVGGCSIAGTQITATQPDQSSVSGTTYVLSADSGKVVTGCKDNLGHTVALATCLANASYSSFLELATDRVIVN